MTTHKLVIIESPYAGNVQRNIAYARACMRHALSLGEAPIASHLLYTQEGVLDDNNPEHRAQGIAAGLAWRAVMDYAVFYVDLGLSHGMEHALDKYTAENKPFYLRNLPIEFWPEDLP